MTYKLIVTAILLLTPALATPQTGLIGASEDKPMYVCSEKHSQPCASPPSAKYDPDPEYPEKAREEKVGATVVLWAIITTEGTASHIRVAKSAGQGFDEAAIDGVKRWRFDPGLYDGKPVPVMINIAVNFKPD